jgi:hypothetical protein
MANELTITARLALRNGDLYITEDPGSISLTQSTPLHVGGTQVIPSSSHNALDLNDVATRGYAYFRNTDATRHVSIGTDSSGTFVPFLHLEPGEFALCRLSPAVVPYAKAAAGTVNLHYTILSD